MAIDPLSEEGQIIKRLIPLANMPNKWFKSFCELLTVEEAEVGCFLFKIGDDNTDLLYLLSGTISLEIDDLKIETIISGSDSARFSLAHQIPRKVNGLAKSKIRYLRLQADMMKFTPEDANVESKADMIDNEMTENDDWMTTLLMSPIFRALPPANLQKVLMSLQEVNFRAGEMIIQQGGDGDYYYIIKKGQCLITRKPSPNAKDIKLATFCEQDAFGEDALISGQPRNASVSAITDVSLLRLEKKQFLSLIKQPVLKYLSYAEVMEHIAKGAALIDVREPEDFGKYHLPRSINIPIFSMRMHLRTMNRQQAVVLVCKNGELSETSAFILVRHRFNVFVLQGGIDKLGADLLNSAEPEDVRPEPELVAPVLTDENEVDHLRYNLNKLKAQYKILYAERKALEEKYNELKRHVQVLTAQIKASKDNSH